MMCPPSIARKKAVVYVSLINRNFNKKIARAFDPYTTEIKLNLERGTAI